MRTLIAILIAAQPLIGGEWGSRGITKRFVARGGKVFAADGRGIAVYDVSRSPVSRMAVADTTAESSDLAFLSDREIAVATRNGIERYDSDLNRIARYSDVNASIVASNGRLLAGVTPTGITIWENDTMNVIKRVAPMQPASALAWHGDTLLVAIPAVGVDFITGDNEDFVAENARDIAVIGDTLTIAAGVNGIAIYDLAGPKPAFVARVDSGERNFARIAVSNSRLFAAELPDTISVYDITGGSPALMTRFREPVQAMAAAATRLFVSGTLFDAFGLPTETGAPIRVFEGASLAGEFRDLAGPVSGVATDGTLAYVVDPPYFRVIDVSATAVPRELASMLIDGIGDRVKVRNGIALIFGRGDVQLVDINNPYSPRLISVYHAQGGPPSTAGFGRNALLEGNPYSGFHVVDFTSFAEPRQIGGIKGHYFDVAADGGDVAYVSLQAIDLITIDVADPNNPRSVKSATIGPVLADVVPATENHPKLLVIQTQSGIRIYNLSDPRNPIEMSNTPMAAIGTIAADGDIAYIASAGLVQTMDLTSPSRPAIAPAAIQPFAPMQMAAARGKLVIADRYALRVFGPDTPPPPTQPPTRRRAAR